MPAETTRKPRLSATERAAQRALERQQAQALFEATRTTVWQGLWARAMRLQLLVDKQSDGELREQYSWYFEAFKVDAAAMSFTCEHAPKGVSEETLTMELADSLGNCLETGQHYHDNFVAEKERKRREHEELLARKNAVLTKLTAEDRKLLGLPETYRY